MHFIHGPPPIFSILGVLAPLFKLGLYDDMSKSAWSKFGAKHVGSQLHHDIAAEAALQSFVLLKNDKHVLPLKVGTHVAVVGPQSSGQGLFSDYFGDDICYGTTDRYQSNLRCVPTIAQAVRELNAHGVTTNATGVGITGTNTSGIAAALALAKAADVVVLAMGIDKSVEREGIDRHDLRLPGLQESFALQVLALGKPTCLVLTNGGPAPSPEPCSHVSRPCAARTLKTPQVNAGLRYRGVNGT